MGVFMERAYGSLILGNLPPQTPKYPKDAGHYLSQNPAYAGSYHVAASEVQANLYSGASMIGSRPSLKAHGT